MCERARIERASPHVSGVVALIWSRSMTVRRDIAATGLLLDNNAKDKSDLTGGGTADDDNIWGEGGLNALGSVANPTAVSLGTQTSPVRPASLTGLFRRSALFNPHFLGQFAAAHG